MFFRTTTIISNYTLKGTYFQNRMKFYKLPKDVEERTINAHSAFTSRILVSEKSYVLASTFEKWYPKYNEFECRSTDVWVASFPKSGTTWTQEAVWCIQNDLDFETAKKTMLMKRWDGLVTDDPEELSKVKWGEGCSPGEQWKIANNLKDPRTIKTHLHHQLLPKGIHEAKSKVIYVCRDPRDVCVSYFHHSKKFEGYTGTMEEFADMFLDDLHLYQPYWTNVLDYWNKRHEDNYLFLRYEDLKSDLPHQLRSLARFLGKRIDESKMDDLLEHLSFDKMKQNKTVNNEHLMDTGGEKIPFMRKGKVGDWKESFSPILLRKFDDWIKKNLEGTDFPYYRN